LFRILFALGAALAGIAGALLGPIFAVQVGMGENVLTTLIVAIVIGGIGSIKGAFVGALMVGFVDTAGRAFLPLLFYRLASPDVASNLGPTLASVLIYVLMAVVLFFRPQGLFPVRT
jgi:branched-chain amino acid transport system permease protein